MPGATPQWREVPCTEPDEDEQQQQFDENGNPIPVEPSAPKTKLVPAPAVEEGRPKPVVLDPESKHHDVVVEAVIVHKAYYSLEDPDRGDTREAVGGNDDDFLQMV